jgi:hypothetical protein
MIGLTFILGNSATNLASCTRKQNKPQPPQPMNEYLITEHQADSLANVVSRFGPPISIQGMPFEPEVIMVQFDSIWLGIETDGYTHS